MKKNISYLIIIITGFIFSSCEKKIELHPENSEEKVAVESMFTDNPFVSYFKLSKTKGIYESINNHTLITDASIKITDKTDGTVYNYTYDAGTGKYLSFATGIPGHQYKMEIDAEGQHITAEHTMTSPVNLNAVHSILDTDTGKYALQVNFDDDPNSIDYYLFIMTPNDTSLESRFSVMTDLKYDRTNHALTIDDEYFENGQDWQILMFHIDRDNYNYLHVILRAMKSLVNGAHPFYGVALGNPQSTVYGEQALGYWICSPVSLGTVRIGN